VFTGIVEELGRVVAVEHGAQSARLTVEGPLVAADAVHGASIAVDGVCLTVVDHDDARFTVDVMAETLSRSALAAVRPGQRVNLERAMPADGRFGGHVVQGHVDGTGRVVAREPGDRWEVVTIAVPPELSPYVVEKGSVTVDGDLVNLEVDVLAKYVERLLRARPAVARPALAAAEVAS
jgi:riboflavin synthase